MMRTYGRLTDSNGNVTWQVIETDANGFNDNVYLTALCQTLKLNIGESPFYANSGIPQYQTIMTQTYPDFYVMRTQQQYSAAFASLTVNRVAQQNTPDPLYNIVAVTQTGSILPVTNEIPQ